MRPLLNPMLLGGKKKQTLFATDFGEYTVNSPPDWADQWGTGYNGVIALSSGSISGKTLRWTKTAAQPRQFRAWLTVPPAVDVEVLFAVRLIEAAASGDTIMGAIVRGTGTFGSAYGLRGMLHKNASGVQARTNRWVDSTLSSSADGGADLNLTTSTRRCWVRTSAIGNLLRVKHWLENTAEPATWSREDTYTGVPGPGLVGLSQATQNPNVEVDYFAADITAKTIPLPI